MIFLGRYLKGSHTAQFRKEILYIQYPVFLSAVFLSQELWHFKFFISKLALIWHHWGQLQEEVSRTGGEGALFQGLQNGSLVATTSENTGSLHCHSLRPLTLEFSTHKNKGLKSIFLRH